MRVVAVPVKGLGRSKTRLAAVLDPLQRGALTLAMLEDVLDAALPQRGWETWVVSPDEAVLEIAARRGARPVAEEEPSLTAAVRQVEAMASGEGATALAVLLGDLPLLTEEALGAALRTLGPVVLAPARSDGGTNLLLRRPADAIPSRFGRDSFARHRREASARGLPVALVDRSELALDLDLPADVATILATGVQNRTVEVCVGTGLAARLRSGTTRTRRGEASGP